MTSTILSVLGSLNEKKKKIGNSKPSTFGKTYFDATLFEFETNLLCFYFFYLLFLRSIWYTLLRIQSEMNVFFSCPAGGFSLLYRGADKGGGILICYTGQSRYWSACFKAIDEA